MSLLQSINEANNQSLTNSQQSELVNMLRSDKGLGVPKDEAIEFFAMALENIAGFESGSNSTTLNQLFSLYSKIQ